MKKPQGKTKKNMKNKNILKSGLMRNSLIAVILIVAISIFVFGKNTKSDGITTKLTDATFENVVLKSDKVVMVDFWASWCRPCQMMAPVVEQIAIDYKGKIVVGKMDVDQNREIPATYNIESIPTLLFFKNGKIVDQQLGYTTKEVLKQKIELLLK